MDCYNLNLKSLNSNVAVTDQNDWEHLAGKEKVPGDWPEQYFPRAVHEAAATNAHGKKTQVQKKDQENCETVRHGHRNKFRAADEQVPEPFSSGKFEFKFPDLTFFRQFQAF